MALTEPAARFLTSFAAWAAAQAGIQAVALVGSHARGAARPASDIDLVILADDPRAYLADTTWSRLFGSVIRVEIEDYGTLTSLRVWYGDGLEVEYGFTDLSWIDVPLDRGTQQVVSDGLVVLFDRDALLTGAQFEV